MKAVKVDLNELELVKTKEEFGECGGFIIIPRRAEDGTTPPVMFWKKKDSPFMTITDTDTAMWFDGCRISITGSDAEYAKRVDWWVSNAMANDEWKQHINSIFNKKGFKVSDEFDKAIRYLKTCPMHQRKSFIDKFLKNWFTRGFGWYTNRINRNGGRDQ